MGVYRRVSQLRGKLVGKGPEDRHRSNPEKLSKPTRVLRRWFGSEQKIKIHRIHQLVAREWVPNPEGKRCVDHHDGGKTNNNYENLRYATHTENGRNMKKHSDGSSIYKGVSWDRGANKWRAQIKDASKVKNLGVFTNEREAAETYNAAAVEFHKEFAKLNVFED